MRACKDAIRGQCPLRANAKVLLEWRQASSPWSGRGAERSLRPVGERTEKRFSLVWQKGQNMRLGEDHLAYDVHDRRLAVLLQQRVEFAVDAADRRHAFLD